MSESDVEMDSEMMAEEAAREAAQMEEMEAQAAEAEAEMQNGGGGEGSRSSSMGAAASSSALGKRPRVSPDLNRARLGGDDDGDAVQVLEGNARPSDQVDEADVFGQDGEDGEDSVSGAADEREENAGLGTGNNDDDDDEEEEIDQTTMAPANTVPSWALGHGIHPIPPSDSRSAVHSLWSMWDEDTKLRPAMHLALGYPNDLISSTTGQLGVFKNFDRKEVNRRSASCAALFGHLDYAAKGNYVDGMGLLEEEALPDDPKQREEAIAKMKPLKSLMFKHRFRAKIDQETREIVGDEQFPINQPEPNTGLFSHAAPCEQHILEVRWTQREVDAENGDVQADDRGVPCDVMIHKLVYNKNFRPSKLQEKVMNESNEMQRAGRATRCDNSKRKVGSEKAAKQQRVMVADEDVERSSAMKYAQICDNFSLVQHLQSHAGVGCGGSVKSIYRDMQGSLGNGSLHRDISEHKSSRNPADQHALAPECLFNFRDGANPPKNLFPRDQFPEYYTDRPADKPFVGRVAQAGTVGADGVSLAVHPKQLNPENYFDDDGFLTFPFPDSVYVLTNYQMPLRDCTMPNLISSGPSPGPTMLKAFWETNKESDSVITATEDTLRELARRSIVSNTGAPPTSESQLLHTMERLKYEGRPTFDDMKMRLDMIFSETLNTADSIMDKRLRATVMASSDSLDVNPLDSATRPAGLGGGNESNVREVKIATESTARTIGFVLDLVDKAVELRKQAGDPNFESFKHEAKREAMIWGIRSFVHTYDDPRNASSVYPVAREIWRTTPSLIRKIPDLGGCAIVDKKHPNRRNGSANIAFCFNSYIKMDGVSTWGNYQSLLAKIYGPRISGVQGRNYAIRKALHDGMLAPAGPKGFREMIAFHGVKSMAKSMVCSRFKYIFNRPDDPDMTRNWIQSAGGGSARALQAGGIIGGGATVADEALRAVASGGQNDPAATEQMEDLKQICTDGQTARQRCEPRKNAEGQQDYFNVIHVMKDNTTRIMCHNLGANICHKGKGAPIVPEASRDALIDRVASFLAVENAQTDVTGDDVFQANVAKHTFEITAHTLIVSLTYMCLEMASHVSRWRPPGETQVMRFWSMLDDFMLSEYDIPKPDARRQTLRRNNALQKAIEHAVVRVFLYKDEAVAFKDMLPTSKPFSQDSDPSKCVHVLSPWDYSHLANVFQIAVFDPETVLDAWSCYLDRNLYTIPDTHHILLEFGKMHGIQNMSNATIASNWLAEKDEHGKFKRVPNNPTQPGSGSGVDSARDGSGTQEGEGSGGGLDPSVQQALALQGHQSEYTPFGSGFDDSGLNRGSDVGKPPDHDLGAAVSWASRHENARGEDRIREQRKFIRLRRRVINSYTERCKTLDIHRLKEHPCVADHVKAAFNFPTSATDDSDCRLPTGDCLKFKLICDMIIPTFTEIADCGYRVCDMRSWLDGRESDPFGKEDAEGIYLGVPLGARRWSFQRRDDMPQFTEYVYDCSWRTTRTSAAATLHGADSGDAGGDGGGGGDSNAPGSTAGASAAGGSGATQSRLSASTRSWEANLWIDTNTMAKNIGAFEIDRLQIFDRLAQIINNPDAKKLRKIQVSPDTRDDLERLSEVPGIGQTSMRLFDPDVEPEKVSGKAPYINKKLFNPVSGLDTKTRSVIPLRAVGWRHTTGVDERHHVETNPVRDHQFADNMGMEIEDLAQCRFDRLVSFRSLPAANPLTSSIVVMAAPVKQEKGLVYINSSFFISQARLAAEIDISLSSIPGIRSECIMDPLERYSSSQGNALSAVDNPQEAVDGITEANNGGGISSSSNAGAGSSGNTGATAPDPPIETNTIHSAYTEAPRLSTAVSRVAAKMHAEGRDTVTDADIDSCHAQMLFKETTQTEKIFDKVSVYYTFQAHELVNWNDPPLFAFMVDKFPSVFGDVKKLKESLPETITRFLEFKSNQSADIAHGPSFATSLLSSTKRMASSPTPGSVSGSKKKKQFSQDELASVQRAYFEDQAVWHTDIKELRKIALMYSCSSDPSSVDFCDRSKWREHVVDAKIKSGVIHKDGGMKMQLADTGMSMLRAVRVHVARNPRFQSGIADLDMSAKYLRPYKVRTYAGTCSATERDKTRIAISMAYYANIGQEDTHYDSDGPSPGADAFGNLGW